MNSGTWEGDLKDKDVNVKMKTWEHEWMWIGIKGMKFLDEI